MEGWARLCVLHMLACVANWLQCLLSCWRSLPSTAVIILCLGLILLPRSCTNGCYSLGATHCCPLHWEMTSTTWGKSLMER